MKKHQWKKTLGNQKTIQNLPWQLNCLKKRMSCIYKLKALFSRPDIAKLLLESENPNKQANTSVNAGLLNTSTCSASKDIFIPPQQPTGLAAPPPPMQLQTAPIAPVMPVQYQQGYFMQSAQSQSANLQSLPSVPFVSEEQEVVTFTTGQRWVMAFCVKCFDFQILHEVAEWRIYFNFQISVPRRE